MHRVPIVTSQVNLAPASPYPHLLMSGGVPYFDAGDIRDESAAGFVAGSNDPRKTSAAERLSSCGIGDHDLVAAKKRIDFASTKH